MTIIYRDKLISILFFTNGKLKHLIRSHITYLCDMAFKVSHDLKCPIPKMVRPLRTCLNICGQVDNENVKRESVGIN
jgi:hypothetical protein